jgi:ABC-type uncharacterized transport system ATPase component
MNNKNSGKVQGEFCDVEVRANVIRRLLQLHNSVQSQDTLGIKESIQVAEQIEKLARLAQQDDSENHLTVHKMIATLRKDLNNRLDELDIPEISGGEV